MVNEFRILIVDDDASIHEDIRTILVPPFSAEEKEVENIGKRILADNQNQTKEDSYNNPRFIIDDVYQGEDAVVAVKKAGLEKRPYSLIFMDVRMPPGIDGVKTIKRIWRCHPFTEVILITAFADYSLKEIHAELGQTNKLLFLRKPVDSVSLKQAAIAMTTKWDLERKNRNYINNLEQKVNDLEERVKSAGLKHPQVFKHIITASKEMSTIFQKIEAIGEKSSPVLITGETGVGKGLIAKTIHEISGRKGEFVYFDVGEIDNFIFVDTLFGHVKGSFTDAVKDRAGLVEEARQGTLFLDEIGNLNKESQKKLLHFLQEREYRPIGKNKPTLSDARIIAATNEDIKDLLESGKLRRDLYYRLCVHLIHVPPIRVRKDDIRPLTNYFIEKAAREYQIKKPTVPPELYSFLETYHFPGNVRELENIVKDAISQHTSKMLSMGIFKARTFPKERADLGKGDTKKDSIIFPTSLPTLRQMRKIAIAEALKRSKGSKSTAAVLLGITPQALCKYLNRQGLNQKKEVVV